MGVLNKLALKRTAKSITRRAMLLKLAAITTAGLTLVAGVTYVIAYFYQQSGSFTVNLNRYDMLQTGLSLSDNREFIKPISRLTANPLTGADNISINDLPNNLNELDGENSNVNFISYTYYVKNSGKSTVTYQNTLNIENASQNIDAAIRVKVYENDKPTVYAKAKTDNVTAENGTTPFVSSTIAMQSRRSEFAPDDYDKYTVIIWLEGDDPECVDSIIGGTIKFTMNVKIIESS
ncbi:MAG: hypothetical protein RR436_04640 [Clostridia bacterium]